MSKNQTIKRRLYQLFLIPCVLSLLILSVGYYFLHDQFIADQKLERETFILSLFNDFSGKREVDAALLDQVAMALLAMEGFRTLAVVDNNFHPLWLRGLPISPAGDAVVSVISHAKENNSSYCKGHICYTLIQTKITLSENQKDAYSPHAILVVTDELNYSIVSYQAALIIVIIFGLCLLVAIVYLHKFQQMFLDPLEKIHAGIHEFISGRYERYIPTKNSSVYSGLTNDINSLAKLQKAAQENLQQNIDQSTAELRETLETVEIQNIELDIARKSALQSSRVKSEFLANTSHEIRTPLNGIIGFSELLKKTELNTLQKEYLETIDESAKGLLTIINDILDFSRLEIGKLTLEYKPVRLRQVIEESLRLQAPSAQEKNLRLLTIIDHDIPEHLLGDPLRLKQVLTNLLSNAIKFTNSGYILVNVSKDDRADNQITLQFRITDSGIGLNQAQQEELFDAFTQLDSSESRAHGGTGLGLAIAKGLVDRMNGQIGVESEPGRGATFWFTSILGKNPNAANTNGYLTGTLRNIRVLVYDNASMSRTEITHYLRGWGAEVTEINRFDEIEAHTEEACRNGQIHLAIIDAQIDDKTFDKSKLREIIDRLNQDYSIPVVVPASASIQRLIEPAITNTHSTIIQRPILCNRLHQSVCEQLGIIIADTAHDIPINDSKIPEEHNEIHILAVDDNPANLRLVTELLKDIDDVHVVAIDNGADALRANENNHFDLILMDIQMPGMDGLEATRELRKRENPDHRTPVVALTAHAVNEQKSKLLLAGMDDYLTKPVSENELRHIIDRWVSRNPHKRVARNKDVATATVPGSPHTDVAPQEREALVSIRQSLELAKNKPDLARDMLNMLLDSLPSARADINTYLSEGNHKELQEVIHKLHGGCCYCGVPRLKKYSSDLDVKLQTALQNDEQPPLLEEKISQLIGVIDQMLKWHKSVDVDALFEADTH
ncbi:response regulator [Teredinibacter haidensis]|uniref:response regulator n=1 Tax=Teredinibacter haidensis TaxID=2731755 RepID=UPI0009FB6986|nr:response regulator [Teredinibacter haidensis]